MDGSTIGVKKGDLSGLISVYDETSHILFDPILCSSCREKNDEKLCAVITDEIFEI